MDTFKACQDLVQILLQNLVADVARCGSTCICTWDLGYRWITNTNPFYRSHRYISSISTRCCKKLLQQAARWCNIQIYTNTYLGSTCMYIRYIQTNDDFKTISSISQTHQKCLKLLQQDFWARWQDVAKWCKMQIYTNMYPGSTQMYVRKIHTNDAYTSIVFTSQIHTKRLKILQRFFVARSCCKMMQNVARCRAHLHIRDLHIYISGIYTYMYAGNTDNWGIQNYSYLSHGYI